MAASETTPRDSPALDPEMLATALAVAAHHARRLARTMRLAAPDREDAEQAIVLVLLERRRYFELERGPWRAFAHRIARQAVQAIADDLGARRRAQLEHGESQPIDSHLKDGAELACDLARFVSTLPPDLAPVARLILDEDGNLAAARRRSGLSSSEFSRRLGEVRARLVSLGIVPHR